ncbi:phosphatidylserine decarboxylase [Bacillus sp. FJAT-27916]|uniref:phosphatidylserine decarboxylase n=1 Tax=Bacillaceae TaxID=186817 RepID=UPI0006712C31|nr:phosphatidylserine decarboxylase [Bacillus sp. FJAT-27916]KMY43689.1 phosphatidylserine decarboxylase [Bacillus sp. FJAT-27916]
MKEKLYQSLIELTNGRWTSSLLRRFALSPASKRIIPSFAKQYKINVEEMDRPLEEYESLHDFFTRKLMEGARPIDQGQASIASPVDAVLEDMGSIANDATFRVKGKLYSIEEMLGGKSEAERYLDGQYMVLYLSPSHYHRIHSPVDGTVIRKQTLGSKSYPVNRYGMTLGKSPLSKNYREITEIEYKGGRLALIKVGAMFVNTIERTHTGDTLLKGEEIGYFSFGSTVVLLFEKGTFKAAPFETPAAVRAGETLGTCQFRH